MLLQIKGLVLFLVQFVGDDVLYNLLVDIIKWVVGFGYKGVQIFIFDSWLFDLEKVFISDIYCDEVKGICVDVGVEIIELLIYLQG